MAFICIYHIIYIYIYYIYMYILSYIYIYGSLFFVSLREDTLKVTSARLHVTSGRNLFSGTHRGRICLQFSARNECQRRQHLQVSG